MDKRVLITGIRGFAGGYLSRHLTRQGYLVVGTSVHDGNAVDGAVDILKADLRDMSQIKSVVDQVKPTHVVHLAAISNVTHEDVREIYETNIVGSRNLLRALEGLSVAPEAVLMTSSANVYGNSHREVLSETDELNPANDYGVSKVAMEYMARTFASRLNLIIARPFNYTGRGQSNLFLIPKIVNHFKARAEFIELGNTDVARDFSDVRSVVVYFQRLLETPAVIGGTYNICSGIPYSLKGILDMCAEISGHKLEVRIDKRLQRSQEVKILAGNPARLHGVVGIVHEFPLMDTLTWMLKD